jgi:ribosomal protein S27E
MALRVRDVTCGACGRTHSVDQYVPHDVRFKADMDRQVRDNEAFERLAETGVACTKCGGNNTVPTDGTVQIVCRFCSQTILLSDHVDAGAIARARLKNAVFGMRDELQAQQVESQRNWRIGVTLFVVLALGTLAIANVMGLIPQ